MQKQLEMPFSMCNGTKTTYQKGCRCDACRKAGSERKKQWMRDIRAKYADELSDFSHSIHGKHKTYLNLGCRCDACVEANLAQSRKRNYGLGRAEFFEMLRKQNNCCALCGLQIFTTGQPRTGNIHVDHCHESGAVRGLLCVSCNTGLGRLGDGINGILNAALRYLERFENENRKQGGIKYD